MRKTSLAALAATTAMLAACTTTEPPATRAEANAGLSTASAAGSVCGTYGLMDKDGNGHISKAEWDAYHAGAYTGWDTDHDGRISRAEFERCYAANGFYGAGYYEPDYSTNYYSAFDPNNTGYVTADDFFGDRTWVAIDRNNNGVIDDDEWTWSAR
jgi:hypothetical protein